MRSTLLLLAVLGGNLVFSQPTGNFNDTIYPQALPFNGQARALSFHVPENYDPDQQYALIVGLHGTGMNSTEFRDAMLPLVEPREMIAVAVDGNGPRHDDEFDGAEIVIVAHALDTALARYNINPDAVYLHGMSWGGRESLYFGLGNHHRFRGIIPMGAAVQSFADADNQAPGLAPFPYEQAPKVPVCLCIGELDNFFLPQVERVHENLEAASGEALLNVYPNVGHTALFPDYAIEMSECLDFFDAIVGPVSGTQELQTEPTTVFPNPAIDRVTWETGWTGPLTLRLFDLQGRLWKAREGVNSELLTVDLVDLPAGTYLFEVEQDGKRMHQRIVKARL